MSYSFSRSEQAIAELSRKYGGLCRKIALQILNDPQDAEKCMNDAWLGAWNSIPPKKPDPLAAYICRITRNLALKKYHHKTAQKRNSFYDISLSELEDCIPSEDQTSEPCTEDALKNVIEDFLDTLDKKSRIIFVKRYWYAESVKSIADAFGMTENHTAVKLLRIRGRMKAYLEKRGVIL